MKVVIVSQRQDPHVDTIILNLRKRGLDPHRINTDDIPNLYTMEFEYQEEFSCSIKSLDGKEKIDLNTVTSYWWRRPQNFKVDSTLSKQESIFAQQELSHVFNGILNCNSAAWVSHPDFIKRASFKPEQLFSALNLGFLIPETLITQDVDKALAFFKKFDNGIIYKVLSDPLLAASKIEDSEIINPNFSVYKATLTTLITEKEIKFIDSIKSCPCQFQRLIHKKYDVRIVIIGKKIFGVRILSQEYKETKIDWRDYTVDLKYLPLDIPIHVKEKCFDFIKLYNLNFSTLDFIVDEDDNYYFLENNPNGQFLFIEENCPEIHLADAMCDLLINPKENALFI